MMRLSPSDFAFLWEQCKRCFYLKVVHNVRQPSMPMAAIFKKLEGLQMGYYDGKRTSDVLPSLPPGIFRCGEKVVESEPIEGWFIYGKIDSLLEFDDGTWGILDFKTTTISPEKGTLYGRQLHAYAYAFQHPAERPQILKGQAPKLGPFSKIGILCFEPSEFLPEPTGHQTYRGRVEWIEIPQDPDAFVRFVGETMKVLKGTIPDPSPDCEWCSYALRMKEGILPAPRAVPAASGVQCPQCGSPMVQRSGRYGEFWGCTQYPQCKGTRKALPA